MCVIGQRGGVRRRNGEKKRKSHASQNGKMYTVSVLCNKNFPSDDDNALNVCLMFYAFCRARLLVETGDNFPSDLCASRVSLYTSSSFQERGGVIGEYGSEPNL